jgi:hypothetical protein
MRTSTISICAVVAVITGTLCLATYADPLAPGKPAGVRAAQMGNKELLVFGGLGVLAAAVLIANAGGDGHAPVPAQAITVVTPTTT